jgi:hypothetical protein
MTLLLVCRRHFLSHIAWTLTLVQNLRGHLSPILDILHDLHNFTIESQVQFHAPLGFKPCSVNDGYGLTPEDLTVFINSAEWTLCDYFHSHVSCIILKGFFKRRVYLMIRCYILFSLSPLLRGAQCLYWMRMVRRSKGLQYFFR